MTDNKKEKLSRLWWILRIVGFCASISFVLGGVLGLYFYSEYSEDLPEFNSVEDYKPKLVSRAYSSDGRLIGEFGIERRIVVPYERIPKQLIQAFVSTEDKKFFDHHGIDYVGIIRAVLYRVIGKSSKIGGTSTITQQLAKGLLISHEGFKKGTERTIRRKAREAILAKRLESKLSKEEILWIYLNQVYLGHGAYGVQAAAENYFRKDVQELSIAEMALIAGLPQAPSRFSPFVNPKSARARQKIVLERMVRNKYITEEQRNDALSMSVEETAHARDDRFAETAPYFTEHIRRYVYDNYGEKALYEGGLQIYTTLDLERQNHAENALVNGIRAVDKRQGWRGPIAQLASQKDQQSTIDMVEKEDVKGAALKEETSYMAVVLDVDAAEKYATVQVGHVKGVLPLAGMRWARKPNTSVWWERDLQTNIRKIIQKGDVILVIKSSLKELKTLARDKSIAKKIPVDEILFKLDQVPQVQGSLIAINPHTGYVEAMIGGYSFEESEFNRAFQACRQPGSSFKPIVYSAAVVREDYNPATMIMDTPIVVRDTDIGKSWKPQNFELNYQGEVTARQALMNSMNVPAIRTMGIVGVKETVQFAHRLGIRTELKEEPGTAIGSSCVHPWELTHVYTTWARGGLRPQSVFIKSIINRNGVTVEEQASPNDPWQSYDQRLDALYTTLDNPPVRTMEAIDAYLVNYLLTQVATHGTAARASSLGQPVAGKTGTTNDSYDTWFVGYTPSLVASVWIGYDRNDNPLGSREQGGRTSLPIWLKFMKNSLRGIKEKPFKQPAGICYARINSRTGLRTSAAVPGTFVAPFRCGTEPKSASSSDSAIMESMKSGGI